MLRMTNHLLHTLILFFLGVSEWAQLMDQEIYLAYFGAIAIDQALDSMMNCSNLKLL